MPTLSRTAARFKERTELLEFMLEAASAATETLDLDRLLAQVAEIIKKVIPYDLLAIMLYSERRQGLSIRHSIGHRPELAKTLLLRLGEGITGTAAAERQPILVDDVRNDKRYLSVLDAQRSYYSAQQGLVATRLGKYANLVSLFAVLGGGHWLLWSHGGRMVDEQDRVAQPPRALGEHVRDGRRGLDLGAQELVRADRVRIDPRSLRRAHERAPRLAEADRAAADRHHAHGEDGILARVEPAHLEVQGPVHDALPRRGAKEAHASS